MPYIDPMRREELDPEIDALAEKLEHATEGDLNYTITRLVDRCLARQPRSYSTFNAAIGILEAAKLELYRRLVSPYEDIKKGDNGDVYETQ